MTDDEFGPCDTFTQAEHALQSRGEAERMSEHTGLMYARVVIERRVTDDDIVDFVTTEDVSGADLPVAEALGMLRLAEHTLLSPDDSDEETP